MKYKLKDGSEIETIPMNPRLSVKLGDVNAAGYLTVVGQVKHNHSNRSARLLCKCKCGNYTIVSTQNFKRGTTCSCGCYSRERARERCRKIGQQSHFKDYTKIDNPFYSFIQPLDITGKDGSHYWLIKCKKCGNEFKEIPAFLVSSTRRKGNNPCSCWRKQSKGVLKIKQLLIEHNIDFIEEKTFADCLSPKNKLLKFDFWINNQYLLEYDGEQHYRPEQFGNKIDGKQKLTLQQEYDQIKNQWAINNQIPLIRIPYYHYEQITLQDLLLNNNKFLIQEITNATKL